MGGVSREGMAPLALAIPPPVLPSRLPRDLPLFWSLLANLHHKGIKTRITAQGWLQGILDREVGRLGKHVLTKEAAYQSLLKRTRQQVHQQIAQVLEAQFPATAETQPEVLARHYTEAGLAEPAVGYWQRAGERSRARSAYVEAVAHCTMGLEVLTALPDTPTRAQQELDMQLTLGTRCRSPRALGPWRQGRPTPVPGSCVVRWGTPRGSSPF
jgi:hypothetical protein